MLVASNGSTNPLDNPIAQQLVNDLLHLMESCQLDFTQTFRSFIEEDAHHPALRDWLSRWKQSLKDQQIDVERAQELMRQCNPVIVPRNYVLVKAIEEAEAGDTTHLRRLLNGLNEPYSEYNKHHPWAQPKPIDVPRTTTYCGT